MTYYVLLPPGRRCHQPSEFKAVQMIQILSIRTCTDSWSMEDHSKGSRNSAEAAAGSVSAFLLLNLWLLPEFVRHLAMSSIDVLASHELQLMMVQQILVSWRDESAKRIPSASRLKREISTRVPREFLRFIDSANTPAY
eukprot:5520760-Pleurochrysis_carterae.AAC.1